jgi:hypothetical protein
MVCAPAFLAGVISLYSSLSSVDVRELIAARIGLFVVLIVLALEVASFWFAKRWATALLLGGLLYSLASIAGDWERGNYGRREYLLASVWASCIAFVFFGHCLWLRIVCKWKIHVKSRRYAASANERNPSA